MNLLSGADSDESRQVYCFRVDLLVGLAMSDTLPTNQMRIYSSGHRCWLSRVSVGSGGSTTGPRYLQPKASMAACRLFHFGRTEVLTLQASALPVNFCVLSDC